MKRVASQGKEPAKEALAKSMDPERKAHANSQRGGSAAEMVMKNNEKRAQMGHMGQMPRKGTGKF